MATEGQGDPCKQCDMKWIMMMMLMRSTDMRSVKKRIEIKAVFTKLETNNEFSLKTLFLYRIFL